MTVAHRWGVLALATALVGCLQADPYLCASNDACANDGIVGECHFETNTCIYPVGTTVCASGFQDGDGKCFDSSGATSNGTNASTTEAATTDSSTTTSTTSDDTTATTATSVDPSETTQSVDDDDASTTSITTATSTSTTAGGSSSESGSMECEGQLDNLTDLGTVSASSVFNGFPSALSVDGDQSTSWFSRGSEFKGGDNPSTYTWDIGATRCISRIILRNNSANTEPDFQEGYGFQSVTVRVFIDGTSLVYEETFPLPGTPDPLVMAETGGVVGSRVVLEWDGHENPSCGGFSELEIWGS